MEYSPQLLHKVARVVEFIPQPIEKIKEALQVLGGLIQAPARIKIFGKETQ